MGGTPCLEEHTMTPTDSTPPDLLEFGDPAPRGRFRRRNLLAGLATLAVLAAAATGVALASTSSPAPTDSPSSSPDGSTQGAVPDPGGRARGPGGMRGHMGFGGGIAGPMGALHGEFVVPKAGGGYQTLVVQRGAVSSVSTSAITVKSEDGFSATYAVDADTLVNAARDGIGSVKKDDQVSVLAQQKSGDDAALQIGDFTRMQSLHDKFGFGHGRGPDNDGGVPPSGAPTPSPAPTGSTGSSSFGV
jgi:hypothetical protein